MFEKEAEEKKPSYAYCALDTNCELWKDGFQKGVAFGYNKGKEDAKEELEQIRNERNFFQKRCEDIEYNYYCDKLDCQFLSSNEWHYPSKGELPKCDEETQLIFYVNCYYNLGDEEIVTKKRMVLGYYKKAFLRDDVKLFVEKSKGHEEEHLPQAVIAWKEIVLPELKNGGK